MVAPPPRISLFGLSEYMFARVERRADIVANALEPNDAAGARYNRARQEIISALRSSPPRDVKLFDAAERLRSQAPTSPWDRSDLIYSADALDEFRAVLSQLDLGDRSPIHQRRWPTMIISGVEVSVFPDIVIRKTIRRPYIGAIKVRFGRTHQPSNEEAEVAATILRYFLKSRLKDPSYKVGASLCQVIDAFSGRVVQAPRSYKRTMGRVEKACREIAANWVLTSLERAPLTPYERERLPGTRLH